jgi:hypothetical protein
MFINPAKSSCIRFGPQYDTICEEIVTHEGSKIPWVKTCKYLGIEMFSSRSFKCVFDNAKKSFYKSFNAIFGKIGRHASAEVVIHLLKVKCLPIILYGLNACPVNATDTKSLDFAIFKILAKIFQTFSKDIIDECRIVFNIPVAGDILVTQKIKFLTRYSASENHLCKLYTPNAEREMKAIR